MKFHCLYTSSVSACFELENTSPYYAENAFDVTVNGAPALQGVRTNVFSLFDLTPGTEYTVAVGNSSLSKAVRLPKEVRMKSLWRRKAFTTDFTACRSKRLKTRVLRNKRISNYQSPI